MTRRSKHVTIAISVIGFIAIAYALVSPQGRQQLPFNEIVAAIDPSARDRFRHEVDRLCDMAEMRHDGTWSFASGRLLHDLLAKMVESQNDALRKLEIIPKQDLVVELRDITNYGVARHSESATLGLYADHRTPLWRPLEQPEGKVIVTPQNLVEVIRAIYASESAP